MVQYFTRAFFDELSTRLNADEEWAKKARGLSVNLVLTSIDRGASFQLEVRDGNVSVAEAAADVPADFKFEGPYEAWVQLGKGEKDFQALVLTGKIKFRGSMPKVMGMLGQLNRITAIAQQVPKEF